MIFKRSLIAELANLAGAVFTVLFTIVLAVAMVRSPTPGDAPSPGTPAGARANLTG